MRPLLCNLINVGCMRQGDGVALFAWIDAPAIHNDQDKRMWSPGRCCTHKNPFQDTHPIHGVEGKKGPEGERFWSGDRSKPPPREAIAPLVGKVDLDNVRSGLCMHSTEFTPIPL